jgi:ABC-type amino acid transport substrate-binding protein
MRTTRQHTQEACAMSDSLSLFTRRHFVRLAALAGSLSLAVGLPSKAAAAAPRVAAASPSAKPFTNGIDPVSYVGGDGSYARYAKDGIRLGLIEAFPVNYTDPATGQRTGWNTDLVLTALDRANLTKYEFVQGPWESMVPGLQSGRFDVLTSDVHVTPERVKIIDFTTPVFWYGDGLFVPAGNPANVHSWADLAGKRVGVGLGVNYQDWLMKRDDLGELLAYKDQTETAADLVAGRVDAYVAEDANFTGFLKQNPTLPIESVADYVPQSDLTDWTRFGIRKDDRDLNNVLSHAFQEMFIDGTTLGILKKYGLGERNLFAIKGMRSG